MVTMFQRKEGKILNAKKAHTLCTALDEIRNFMLVNGVATKERQKLMRNLRVIDLLVRLLQVPLQGNSANFQNWSLVLYHFVRIELNMDCSWGPWL